MRLAKSVGYKKLETTRVSGFVPACPLRRANPAFKCRPFLSRNQSLHFPNRNRPNSMKTSAEKKFNRYTFKGGPLAGEIRFRITNTRTIPIHIRLLDPGSGVGEGMVGHGGAPPTAAAPAVQTEIE